MLGCVLQCGSDLACIQAVTATLAKPCQDCLIANPQNPSACVVVAQPLVGAAAVPTVPGVYVKPLGMIEGWGALVGPVHTLKYKGRVVHRPFPPNEMVGFFYVVCCGGC